MLDLYGDFDNTHLLGTKHSVKDFLWSVRVLSCSGEGRSKYRELGTAESSAQIWFLSFSFAFAQAPFSD